MKGEDFLKIHTSTHPGYTINVRCLGVMEQLREVAQEVFGDGGIDFFNEQAWSLWESSEKGMTGDHLVAIIEEEKALPPAQMSFAISLAYAISATHVWNAGDKEHAADLAFDAARWLGFMAGIQGSASAEEKLANFRAGRRPVLDKTKFYEDVAAMYATGTKKNYEAAQHIFSSAPKVDDGVSPFFWKDVSNGDRTLRQLIDREHGRPISFDDVKAQLQQARTRAKRKAGKTLAQTS